MIVRFAGLGFGQRLWPPQLLARFADVSSIGGARAAQGCNLTDTVCAGCIDNTPEILEVSILIVYAAVRLNAGSVVGFWSCCSSCPVTVKVCCPQLWLLFLSYLLKSAIWT